MRCRQVGPAAGQQSTAETPLLRAVCDWQLAAQWGGGPGAGGENVLPKLSNSTP